MTTGKILKFETRVANIAVPSEQEIVGSWTDREQAMYWKTKFFMTKRSQEVAEKWIAFLVFLSMTLVVVSLTTFFSRPGSSGVMEAGEKEVSNDVHQKVVP